MPNANIPIIQSHILLKYKSLYHFVKQRHNETAVELRLNYVSVMSNYYYSKFSKYVSKMLKLQLTVADKYDMLGVDENAARRGLFFKVSSQTAPVIKDKFTLTAERSNVLTNIDAPAILSHVAEDKQERFTFEAIFRSITRTLMDNGSSEYCFASDFFYAPSLKRTDESSASGMICCTFT